MTSLFQYCCASQEQHRKILRIEQNHVEDSHWWETDRSEILLIVITTTISMKTIIYFWRITSQISTLLPKIIIQDQGCLTIINCNVKTQQKL